MKTHGLLLLLLLACPYGPLIAAEPVSPGDSPHAQAIGLVMRTRADEIRQLDNAQRWWHDTQDRSWSAKRPVGPGVVDSTHYFEVNYAIDGKIVGSWSVNTRTEQVAAPGEPFRID
jgi:hypothetical protein